MKNRIVFCSVALVSGLLFGLGMVISGMANPTKVIGFLNVAGQWDASLAFVMGGALAVFMPVYHWVIKPRQSSIAGESLPKLGAQIIDKRLLGGSALFGLGWGLAGVCPGPAGASLALGNSDVWWFFIAMLIGFLIVKKRDSV